MNGHALGTPQPAMMTTLQSGVALGGAVAGLTLYQFGVIAWRDHGSAEHAALQVYWPVLIAYAAAVALAAFTAPRAVVRAITAGVPTARFSLACLAASIAGCAMYATLGADGVGSPTMAFYWGGLGALWSIAIAMIHLCRRWRKPLAVRDWTVYAAALALIPLTMIPSVPLWPLVFTLDRDQTLITAATSSFAAHMLIAHYVIFEILERRPRRT
jgi:NADH:ubiquinone oxidoreductase subunit 6 (subunit J)